MIEAQKVNDRWLICNVTIGEYIQRGPVAYGNTQYGFSFYLPETWKGYSIVEEQWEGTNSGETVEIGPQLLIRHPDWTQEAPCWDIPIMVFTLEQWNALQKGDFTVSAAPIGPSKLGSNSAYVFAPPIRYNYAFQTGFEEVEGILKRNPLWPSYYSEENVTIEINPVPAPVEIKSLPTIEKASPEFSEWARQMKEVSQKPVTGLFDTELDIKQEDSGIKLDFSLKNISGEDLAIYFSSSQKFDVFITNQHGGEVYRLPHKALPTEVDMILKKDEKLSFSEVWDYKDNKGNRVLPGKYTITVKILAELESGKIISPDELTAAKKLIYPKESERGSSFKETQRDEIDIRLDND